MTPSAFQTMHTFHRAGEAGTIPSETKLSLIQEDPGLDADEQIDLETQWKTETRIRAQEKTMTIPGK